MKDEDSLFDKSYTKNLPRKVKLAIKIIVVALVAAFVFFIVIKSSTPRPVILGEDTQIFAIDYFDEKSNDLVKITNYSEENIIKILKDYSEKWTMLKSNGYRYGADDVILSIVIADSNKVKSLCFKRRLGFSYSTEGNGCYKYKIIDSERALDALFHELNIDSEN